MPWCFISSVFYDKNKFKTHGKDPISIEYGKIIKSILEFSLFQSKNLYVSFFGDGDPLIGSYKALNSQYHDFGRKLQTPKF